MSVYGDPAKPTYHPEIYPLHNGQRAFPKSHSDFHWQPDFSQPATEDIAVEYALNAFANGSTSLSLSINDVAAFSENNLDFGSINMYGYASVSDVYYGWCNRVAARVTAQYPDALIGVLAYKNTVDPPNFPPHPAVIPFFTFDRYRWAVRADAAQDRDLTERWLARTSRFGWYDWAYGNSYALPRVDHTIRGTALRWAAGAGVRDVFSEIGYSWGEGAKAWVMAKLWWNPDRSADALTAEWCRRAAGRGAGALIAWHKLWERAWADLPRRESTEWYRVNQTGPAAGFTFPGYIEDISLGTVERGRRLLEESRRLAEEPQQQARVDLMIKAYDLYEATAQSYSRSAATPTSAAAAGALVDEVVARLDTSVAAAPRRYTLIAQYQSDPLLRSQRDPRNQGLNWSGWMPNELWALGAYLSGDAPGVAGVRARVDDLAGSAASPALRAWCAMAQALADHRTVSLGTNTGFETGAISPWQVGQGLLSTGIPFPPTIESEHTYEGRHALRTPLVGGAVVQFVTAEPGFFRANIHYRTPAGQPSGPDQVVHTWFARDSAGRNLRMFRSMPQFLSDTTGRWAEMAMQEFLPAGTERLDFYCSLFNNTDGYARGEIEVDGAEFWQIADGVGVPPTQ